jgi:hypothetical protein
MGNIEVHLEERINSQLHHGVKCRSLTGDSASRIISLAHGLGIINDNFCRNLKWINRRRNEVAHNKPIEFDLKDFPRLHSMLPDAKIKELESRHGTREGHYIALLDALEELFSQGDS